MYHAHEFVSRVAENALRLRDSGGRRAVGTYKDEASAVDFRSDLEAARGQISAWVAEATQDLISSVFGTGMIEPLTTVVIGNAI
ncbi:hypothetical protein QYE76_049139 [Lolium multiflorum]|uniref:Serpin domain-containing protein n=1 Tax=Lolium multiflorum TaxID=4521 RepID=A0AAD8SNA7_LOLMU|nr:hypothetical protein QYE76_049139 [Lolium multiflorum]